jgi:hypothetical protein
LKPKPVTVTEYGKDASTVEGAADATSSKTLMSKMPPSRSIDNHVTESTTLRMYLPPTVRADGIGQEKREDEAAGEVLLMLTDGSDDSMKRQMYTRPGTKPDP